MSRFVIIDDTNPSIQYSGPWFDVITIDTPLETVAGTIGWNGAPFNNTLHGVNVTANLSFNFSGSAVIVYGTSITINSSGTQDPTWECFIDNTSIGSSLPSSSVESNANLNNWILCGAGPGQLQDGPHVLTVNASVSKQTFWFDQIQYAPSASVSLNQSLVRIDASDSAIHYSPGWEFQDVPINYTATNSNLDVNLSYTQNSGAFLTYEFSGTSISMFGIELVTGTGSGDLIPNATYTIDDQEPITFPAVNTSANLFDQRIFETGQLSPAGQHKLVVTYLGDNDTHPIAISYFAQVQVKQDGPSSMSSKTPTSSNTSPFTGVPSGTSISAPSGSSSNSSPGKPTDAIIGGVIGGLVVILLLIGMIFLHRRNNRSSKALSEMSSPDVVNPFPPPNPTSTVQPLIYTSNGQSLPSQTIPSKFSLIRNQPSDPASLSTSNSGGIPPLTPFRPQFSSLAFIPPSSESPRLPLTVNGLQTNLDSARHRVPEATTEPLIQRSLSPQRTNARFVWHEDSGVRIPSAEDNIVEFPPLYTSG